MRFFKSIDYYLLINTDMQIVSFSKNIASAWNTLYHKKIAGRQYLNQFIPDEFLHDFSILIKTCLKPEHLVLERTLTFPKGKTYNLLLTLNPIVLGEKIPYILISIQNNFRNKIPVKQHYNAISRYAFLTSHKLRASLNNILKLSYVINESKDFNHEAMIIKRLLDDISQQAESLDYIISALNDLIIKKNND